MSKYTITQFKNAAKEQAQNYFTRGWNYLTRNCRFLMKCPPLIESSLDSTSEQVAGVNSHDYGAGIRIYV